MRRQIDKVNGHPIFKLVSKKTGLTNYSVDIVKPEEPEKGPNRYRTEVFATLKDARDYAASQITAGAMIDIEEKFRATLAEPSFGTMGEFVSDILQS